MGDLLTTGGGPSFGRWPAAPDPSPLALLQPAIDRCFAGKTVEAIREALAAEASADGAHAGWAAEARADLLTKSPTASRSTLRQLTIGRDYDLDAALALEYRLTQHVMVGHDFEGISAMLIDRGRKPQWHPASLAKVAESIVNTYFVPLGDSELRFS